MSDDNDSPIYLELLKQVLEKTEETHSSVTDLRRGLDLHIQKTEFELKGIKDLDATQNALLQEHHDRSVQLRRDNDLREQQLRLELQKVETRVDVLEEPRKILAAMTKGLQWLGGVAVAIASLYGLWKMFL